MRTQRAATQVKDGEAVARPSVSGRITNRDGAAMVRRCLIFGRPSADREKGRLRKGSRPLIERA